MGMKARQNKAFHDFWFGRMDGSDRRGIFNAGWDAAIEDLEYMADIQAIEKVRKKPKPVPCYKAMKHYPR